MNQYLLGLNLIKVLQVITQNLTLDNIHFVTAALILCDNVDLANFAQQEQDMYFYLYFEYLIKLNCKIDLSLKTDRICIFLIDNK